jgi:two-component system, OmpR family, phosphate regulon sensor histidine kinase PhoR
MWILIAVLLALALAWMGRRLAAHRRAVSGLTAALRQGQPFLREERPDSAGVAWDALCRAVNDQIEELRQLRLQQKGQLTQLEATLGSLQEAVLIVDSRNTIQLANRAVGELCPRAREIVGQRLEVVLHSVGFLNYVEILRQGAAAPRREIEVVEGEESRWYEITGALIPPLDDQPGRWAVLVLHDITRQKQLERMRKEFVSNVSHELRTPLSVIKGNLETLVEAEHEIEPAQRQRFLLTAQRHADRLAALVEDLLTLSRLESSQPGVKLEPVLLRDLLQAVVDDHQARPAAAEHQLVLAVPEVMPAVAADRRKLCQVIENLVENAIKYTPAGSRIELLGTVGEGRVQISVRDNGPGIPAKDLPHLFERFYRVEKGRSREKGGTGLGLSIVKHIVQLHGGRVWVESKEGEGTTFHLELPLAASAGAA